MLKKILILFLLFNSVLLSSLALLSEGYINKTCVFEVKRIADIPKRQI